MAILGQLAVAGICLAFLGRAANQDCVSCHPAETKLHEQSRMAHAMVPALQSTFGTNLPDQPLHESGNGFAFTFGRTPTGITMTARRGNEQAEGTIEWVLGAGSQGQTPLVSVGGSQLESRISYFPQLGHYGITIGQEGGASPNTSAALGVVQSPRAYEQCLGCHSTAGTPGVQCERCHPGASEHAKGKGRPLNPGKLSSIEQVRFCGACHRIKPPVDETQLENVRFQPLRLVKSRCFASGKLTCVTCHPAHQDARRNDDGFYNTRCHACHDGTRFHADARQTGDCIGCHMPKAQLHPALRFTDHYIR